MSDQQREAFALLDQAITACFNIEPRSDGVPVDAVLIIGVHHIDDDGDHLGHVEVYPRTGAQPSYITRGLLDEAHTLLDNEVRNAEDDD